MHPTFRTSWFKCLIAGFLHSLFFVLSFPPFNLWPLAFIALFPLAILGIRTTSRKRAFISVWFISSLFWLWVQRWVFEVAGFGYPIFCVYLGLWPALFVVMLSWLAPQSQAAQLRRLSRSRMRSGSSASLAHTEFSSVHPIPAILLVPVLWVCLELLRCDIIANGYPWFKLGLPLINVPAMCQSADLFGTYYLSFTTALVAGLLVDLISLSMFRKGKLLFRVKYSIAFVILIHIFSLAYGIVRIKSTPTAGSGGFEVKIAAVQTNTAVSNKMKLTIKEQIRDFRHFLALTRSWAVEYNSNNNDVDDNNAGEDRWVPDLIIWPETMVPGLGLNPEMLAEIARFERETDVFVTGDIGISGLFYHDELSRLSLELQRPILAGAMTALEPRISIENITDDSGRELFRIRPTSQTLYNSVYMYLPDGTQSETRYDKIELTPFGEYIPLVYRWPVVEDFLTGLAVKGSKLNLEAGTDISRFEVPVVSWVGNSDDNGNDIEARTLVVATPICFESMVSRLCRRLVWEVDDAELSRAADILIAVTNDGWFANNKDGRMQHIQLNQMRCIENRVPMVQAANTGISAYIDSAGYVVQLGPNYPAGKKQYNDEGVMFARVQLDNRRPLFATIGNTFAWLCLVGTILIILIRYSK